MLTARQHDVLETLADLAARNGIAPTLEEIGSQLGLSRPSILYHLEALTAAGYITRLARSARSVALTDLGRQALQG